jgi:hypothetical protein
MKQIGLVILASFLFSWAYCQDVVNWSYTVKKVSDKTYEFHMKANVQSPWHIYSQNTPVGGPVPTKISYIKNPLMVPFGRVKENGNLLQKHEEVFGVDVKYYNDIVEFVQVVKVKKEVKTNIQGTIEFMTCNDEQCLPPRTIYFSVKLP